MKKKQKRKIMIWKTANRQLSDLLILYLGQWMPWIMFLGLTKLDHAKDAA